jgi:cytochrome c peroxidase
LIKRRLEKIAVGGLILAFAAVAMANAEEPGRGATSYMPVDIKESLAKTIARMSAEKPQIEKRQMDVLQQRYDLSNRPDKTTVMDRTKPVQDGVRVKLAPGITWEQLGAMSPEEIKSKDLFPAGFLSLPHVNQPEGGMVFPQFHIDAIKAAEDRDLTRFDLDFDLPDHFLPEFPPAMYLTTRPDLGDVTHGKLININNYYETFNGILNPKQLEGMRLLLTPFPQQQFNFTEDRRSLKPSRGVSCLECHTNGHTNAAFHLAGDVRPQEYRHRVDTPTLRGVNIQRLFGSQRALKTVEDFTEFEQRGAYFDGDHVIAAKKGVNVLDRGGQVHEMSEVMEILDYPPAPKLRVIDGKLDPRKATAQEMHGQEVFFGKGQCAQCHTPPFYTDNLMHDLQLQRFFKPHMINNVMASGDGPIKTFPLRGIKDSPPYLHDGRLLTLDDSVEFFNVVLETQLTAQEKKDLVAFLKAL